ncbi:hypothetical protein MIND_00408300 [Mycena indigotica]|uniref:Autophagy-related protein 4 n=1 Tax=Mycena indigotica TaxID=2126181 RepID=A0A8H6T4P9_9AGAR|nr:uncharacterized protein MIND_00408300 [Mycena indigotica]KAF7310342.1 hypothetical protein MIND_00408300 [Mycena indigotica]
MSPTSASKLPRFLQSPAQRDRSRSLSIDPPRPSSSASTSSSTGARRKFLGMGRDKDKERERERIREAERGDPSAAELLAMEEDEMDSPQYDPGMASSPPSAYATARARTRADRQFSASTPPGSSSSHSSHSHSSHPHSPATMHIVRSPSRLSASGDGGLTTRLSGWFSHLAGSTSDLSLTGTIGAAASLATSTSRTLSSSAKKPRKNEGQASAKTGTGVGGGGGLLDKAVRYLLDGDANPDRSTAEIWLMGVRMEGWSREDEARFALSQHHHSSQSPNLSASQSTVSNSTTNDELGLPDPGPWPAAFHAAFYAQVWCTYRAGFPEPIRDLAGVEVLGAPFCAPPNPAHHHLPPGVRAPPMHSPTQSDASASSYASSSPSSSAHGHHHGHGHGPPSASSHSTASSTASSSGKKRWWALPISLGSSKGWSSDTGWGCMLRTTQSLLATAIGRVGAPPLLPCPPTPFPPNSPAAHAAHARLLSWFADSPMAPFSVHRMALAGKKAGKDVGMWFGPSAAGVALRTLVDAFPGCGLGVAVGQDGTIYASDVLAAARAPPAGGPVLRSSASGSSRGGSGKGKWDRPVLVLLGLRLGLDGVNPVYHETIKALFTFPQSVGIAGGRPSSSYYFVGVQGDGLFYLDPHHTRPTVPLRAYVDDEFTSSTSGAGPGYGYGRGGSMSPERGNRGGSMSPELVHRAGSMSPDPFRPMTEDELVFNPRARRSPRPPASPAAGPGTAGAGAGYGNGPGAMSPAEEAHWARAYALADMRTYHCERVRKMPLAGLDPSMLIGFVVRDEREWADLRRRVGELPRTIFAIQDEPPSWGADDDDELEGISDPEEEPVAELDVEGDNDNDLENDNDEADDGDVSSWSRPAPAFGKQHFHSDSASTTHSRSTTGTGTGSSASQGDTEDSEGPVGPMTPLPGAGFDLRRAGTGKGGGFVAREEEDDEDEDADGDADGDDFVDAASEIVDDREDDIEDDWVDPVSSPPSSTASSGAPPPSTKSKSSASTASTATDSKHKSASSSARRLKSSKGKKAVPVPVPSVHYPFPGSGEDVVVAHERERDRNVTVVAPKVKVPQQQHHGQRRARDGGRTQSGGVRGVLTED